MGEIHELFVLALSLVCQGVSWEFKHLEGTGNRRLSAQKTEDFAENRQKPQIVLRHLRSVTFSSALERFLPRSDSGNLSVLSDLLLS